MKEFKDKVAVITGAASGIGYGIAKKCSTLGMKVVIADIDRERLKKVEEELKNGGTEVLSMIMDVAKSEDSQKLRDKTIKKFGAVHLLFNNVGVGNTKYYWNYTLKDWEWQLGVCLFGVIYGIHYFLKDMMNQDEECCIINTSSIEGLVYGSGPGSAIYGVSKHGIVSLSETLQRDLEMKNSKVKVFVLCPGFVDTRIFLGGIHRPNQDQNDPGDEKEDTKGEDIMKLFSGALEESPIISPEKTAEVVFDAITKDKFYILTHTDQFLKEKVQERFDGIMKAFETGEK